MSEKPLLYADDVEKALLAVRKRFRTTDEQCIVLACILAMRSIPTVDAVEVVRCKDCTAYCTRGCCEGFGWCKLYDMGKTDADFCSHGERKNNDS